MGDITFEKLTLVIAVVLSVIAAYSSIMSAIKTYRDETKRKNEPVENLKRMLENDKARLDNHEAILNTLQKETADTKDGLNRIGQGVTALLEHELHNGNSIEMEEASKNIHSWVWAGRTGT